jgi:hypothetical protein
MNRPIPKLFTRCLVVAFAAAVPAVSLAKSGEFAFVVGDVTLVKANGQRSS